MAEPDLEIIATRHGSNVLLTVTGWTRRADFALPDLADIDEGEERVVYRSPSR